MLLYANDLESLATTQKGADSHRPQLLLPDGTGITPLNGRRPEKGIEWLGMETEYSSYRLQLTEKRARWLVTWLREKSRAGNVTAKEMAQGLGRLGFVAISLDWERPFLGPLYAWSSAIQGRQAP